MISDRVLYLVRDGSFGPDLPVMLGICVEVRDGWVGFHDTNRGHQFNGELVAETEDGFVWHRYETVWGPVPEEDEVVDMGLITFKALTLEEYDTKVRPYVVGPVPAFHSTEELYEFYWKEFSHHGYHY